MYVQRRPSWVQVLLMPTRIEPEHLTKTIEEKDAEQQKKNENQTDIILQYYTTIVSSR